MYNFLIQPLFLFHPSSCLISLPPFLRQQRFVLVSVVAISLKFIRLKVI